MCTQVYYRCSHPHYVKECVAKYEPEASCCFGGGGGCRGIYANVTGPEDCPDCKARKAATRAAKNHGWYGSSSRGVNRLNNKSSYDSFMEPNLMERVAAMPGSVTYDPRRRGPPTVQPAHFPQGRRTRDAPQRQPINRKMPSIHEISHRPQYQSPIVSQPQSVTMVYPPSSSFRHDSQHRQQQPQMTPAQGQEPPSFARHMQQHTTTQRVQPETATPARQKSRYARPQRAQGLPQPVRKPTRRDSNGVSDFGSDDEDEDDRRYPWTPSPSRDSFHPQR